MAFFGGTFDPVHFGHLITARAVAEQLCFERITLVPAATPPHKDDARATAEHRLAMLQLAVKDDPLFDICRLELSRAGPSYTFDTLTALRAQYGPEAELNWVIGADMLEDLGAWHRAEELLALARVIVAYRPPWQERIPQLLDGLKDSLPSECIEALKGNLVATPLIDVSSCQIRQRVSDGLTVRYLTPASVSAYIARRHLYR